MTSPGNDMFNVHSMSPTRMRNAQTLAVTDPIQIDEGLLSLVVPLVA